MTAAQFWEWFRAQEARVWEVDNGRGGVLDEVQQALSSYREGLGVEISDENDGTRELIISAEGDRDLFDAVDQLVEAAPRFARWTFTALKPPRGFDFVLETRTSRLDPKEIVFEPISNDAEPLALGIRVYLPKATLDAHAEQAAIRVVETGLGERARADLHIEVAPLSTSPEEHIPLVDLPAYLEWFKQKSAAS